MADDIARLGYEIDSSQAAGAAKNLLAMSKAAGDAASSAARLEKQARSSNGQFQSASKYAREHASQIRSLAGEFNTTMARQLAFSEGQKRLADAVKLGVVAEKDHAAQLAILKQRYLDTAGAVDTMGQATQGANRHILNMGFQFQDIGMMMASGQSPFILAMQQGTQVSGIFNQMRMEGQKIGPALIGGITQLINPLSLLTIGAIAAGAALVQWGMAAFGAGDDADSLKEKLDKLGEAVDAVKQQSTVFTLSGLEELRKKYGEVDSQVINLINNQKAFNDLVAQQALKTAIDGLLEVSGSRWYDIGINDLASSILNLRSTLNVTKTDAEILKKAFDDLASATDYQSQLAALDQLGQLMAILASRTGEGQDKAIELLGVINDATDAVKQLAAAAPGREWMNEAIDGVGDLIVALDAVGNAIPAGINPKIRPPEMPGIDFDLPPETRGGGGAARRHERELEAFIESLQTESEKLEAWRVEQFELLNQYNEQELAILGGHNEAKLRLEQEYQDRLTALQEQQRSHVKDAQMNALGAFQDFLGTMSGQSEGAAKVLLAVNTALSISQAIQNTAVAATRALAELGPILGPPAAAKIKAFGAIQVGLIAANGALRMATSGKGSGGGGGAPSSASATTTAQAPERIVRVAFDGPDWARSIIEPIMEQIYEQSRDGTRVIFQR